MLLVKNEVFSSMSYERMKASSENADIPIDSYHMLLTRGVIQEEGQIKTLKRLKIRNENERQEI